MPIEPVKPSSPAAQLDLDLGKEESRPKEQPKPRNPGKAAIVELSDEALTEREAQKNLDKIKSNKAKYDAGQMAEQSRTEKANANEYKKYPASIRPAGGSGGGSGGMGTGKMNRDITKAYKAGGKVSSASSRADGIAIRGKTRA